MAGALDIAIRRMFPESFIAAHPDIVQERKRALEKADPACLRSACLALARVDLSGVLVGIGNRTLVMAGSEDATTPPALARELAAGIPGALPGDPRLRPLLADRRPGRLRERGRGIPLPALQPSM